MKVYEVVREMFTQYGDIDEVDWPVVFELIDQSCIEKGDFFIKAGEINDVLGIVVSGCMRYYYLKDGEEITGEFWQENEVVGSYEGCILQQPASLYIEAIEKTELITLSYSKLKKVALEINGLDRVIIGLLEKLIVESQQRIAAYIKETPEERYLRLREEMPGIESRVHQKYIASFVGVTPVTLSRIRNRLAKRK